MVAKNALLAVVALLPSALAQSGAWGQCKLSIATCQSRIFLTFVDRWWNGLDGSDYLCFRIHLHIQQPILLPVFTRKCLFCYLGKGEQHSTVHKSEHECENERSWDYHKSPSRIYHKCSCRRNYGCCIWQSFLGSGALCQSILRIRNFCLRYSLPHRCHGNKGRSSRQGPHFRLAVSCKVVENQNIIDTYRSDTASKVPLMGTFLANIRALNKAGAKPPVAGTFVVYDLPDRDCAAAASNGEYSIANNGVANYKAYIDAIKALLVTYSDVKVILVVGELLKISKILISNGTSRTRFSCKPSYQLERC